MTSEKAHANFILFSFHLLILEGAFYEYMILALLLKCWQWIGTKSSGHDM